MKFFNKYSLDNHNIEFKVWVERKINKFKQDYKEKSVKPINTSLKTISIVGCGHSGTSLIIGKLSRHADIYAIGNETGWFFPVVNLQETKQKINEELIKAEVNRKTVLVEKTPKHIHSYYRIKKILPKNYFICICRNPLDNIASLYRRFNNINNAIDRWNIDNNAYIKYHRRKRCLMLKYENLTFNPKKEFISICDFIDIEYNKNILKSGNTAYDESKLEGNMLVRKNQVSKEIKPKINTWQDVFTIQEAKFILEKTKIISSKLGYVYNKNLKLDH